MKTANPNLRTGVSSRSRGKSAQKSFAEHLTWDGQERRKHERLRVNWKGVLTRTVSKKIGTLEVQVLNVSEGGCCIHLRQSGLEQDSLSMLAAEERLKLNLFVPGAVLNSLVEVRWYVPIHEEVYGAGLEFVAMNQKDRSLLLSAMKTLPR